MRCAFDCRAQALTLKVELFYGGLHIEHGAHAA